MSSFDTLYGSFDADTPNIGNYAVTSTDMYGVPPPQPVVSKTSESWADWLAGFGRDVSKAADAVANTVANVVAAKDRAEDVQHTDPTPKPQAISPVMMAAIGVGVVFLLRKILA